MAGNLCEVSLAWFSLQLHLSSRHPFAWIVSSSSASAFFFSFAEVTPGAQPSEGKIWGLLQNIHRLVQLTWGMWGWHHPNLPPHPTATGGSCSQEEVARAVCSASSQGCQGAGGRQNHLHVCWFGWPCLVLRIPNMAIAFVVSLTSVCVCILFVVWVKQAKKSSSLCMIWTVSFFCI